MINEIAFDVIVRGFEDCLARGDLKGFEALKEEVLRRGGQEFVNRLGEVITERGIARAKVQS